METEYLAKILNLLMVIIWLGDKLQKLDKIVGIIREEY